MKKTIVTPMTILMISPFAERLHMGLMAAATAAAMGRRVTVFFSKGGVGAIRQGGWQSLKSSEGTPAPVMDAEQVEKGIGDYSVLIDALAAMDVRFIACETALREQGLTVSDLISRPCVDIGGLAQLLEAGSGGDWLTF